MKIKCVDCGEDFQLDDGEVAFYKSKNFDLPKRCSACRELKKKRYEDRGD